MELQKLVDVLKTIGISIPVDDEKFSDEPYTGAVGKVNGAQVRVEFAGDGSRFSGPSIEMINFGIKYKLKGRESIKDIAKLIIKLIDKKLK